MARYYYPVICHLCGRRISRTRNGRFRKHVVRQHSDGTICDGSWRTREEVKRIVYQQSQKDDSPVPPAPVESE